MNSAFGQSPLTRHHGTQIHTNGAIPKTSCSRNGSGITGFTFHENSLAKPLRPFPRAQFSSRKGVPRMGRNHLAGHSGYSHSFSVRKVPSQTRCARPQRRFDLGVGLRLIQSLRVYGKPRCSPARTRRNSSPHCATDDDTELLKGMPCSRSSCSGRSHLTQTDTRAADHTFNIPGRISRPDPTDLVTGARSPRSARNTLTAVCLNDFGIRGIKSTGDSKAEFRRAKFYVDLPQFCRSRRPPREPIGHSVRS